MPFQNAVQSVWVYGMHMCIVVATKKLCAENRSQKMFHEISGSANSQVVTTDTESNHFAYWPFLLESWTWLQCMALDVFVLLMEYTLKCFRIEHCLAKRKFRCQLRK